MKKKFNHLGWSKSFLTVPLLLIPQFTAAIIIFSFGFDLSSMSSGIIDLKVMIILEYIMLIVMTLMLFLFMKYIDKQPFFHIGLQTNGRLKEFNYGIAVGFLIMASAYLFLYFTGEITFEGYILNYEKILLSIVLFAGISLFEEIIFRGYLLKNLLESFNPLVALFISSILFSLIHGSNPNVTTIGLINIFLAGFFLGVSYVFTKNLWFPVALHFSWNFFQSMFGFRVSGLDSYSIIEFSIVENNLLNGGEFGFESSILSIGILIIGTYLIFKYFKKSKN